MPIQIEKTHAGGFVVSEANGTRSRELVVLAASQTIETGELLGKLTAGGQYVTLAPGAVDGSEVAAAIAYDTTTTGAGETAEIVVIARDAEVNAGELVYPAAATDPQKATARSQLATLGVIAR